MRELTDADIALLLDRRRRSDPGEGFYWTGWGRRLWPAEVVRPGVRLYLAVGPLESRQVCAWAEVVRGGSFTYVTLAEFRRAVERATGWVPGDHPHLEELPLGTRQKPCTGIALRWRVLKQLGVRFHEKFPRTGWLQLDRERVAEQVVATQLADLYEGDSRLRAHMQRERNPRLRRMAIDYWTRKHRGDIHCVACDFDFGKKYGWLGQGFIEMHHARPLSELHRRTRQSPEDLLPLCSNCHRMAHRAACGPMSLRQLKSLLRRHGKARV